MSKDNTINLRVSEAFKDKVQKYADDNCISIAELVRIGILMTMNPDNKDELEKYKSMR